MQAHKRRSRVLLTVVLGTIAIIVVVGVVELQGPIANMSSGSAASASDQVGAAFSNHLDKLEAMNITAMEGEYLPNATTEFYSNGQGNYFAGSSAGVTISDKGTGPHEIGDMFDGVFLSDFIIPHIMDDNYTVSIKGNVATVVSTFDLSGTNLDGSSLAASVILHMTYVKSGGNWLISNELWNFTDVVSHG